MDSAAPLARPVIVICGGAVAGSEAAAICAARGALVIVVEAGRRPYGKVEDGLPRWHEALRRQECRRIDDNLRHPAVLFVPETRVGRDVELGELRGVADAVILANGAAGDRRLPVAGADRFVGRGLIYQNSLVRWFNHLGEASYRGEHFVVPDGAIVIGGGLASIDVVKLIQLERYGRALRERGHDVPLAELETRGIRATLERLGVPRDSLAVRDCTLYYRRAKGDMPLADVEEPSVEQRTKLREVRTRIMDRVMERYFVRFEGCARPVQVLSDGDHLRGMRFRRTRIETGRALDVAGSDFDVEAPWVVSSIGSVPEPLAGVPTRGELYDFVDADSGALRGLSQVFCLGNALTGSGNIRASRKNARLITARVLEELVDVAGSSLEAERRCAAARTWAAQVAEQALGTVTGLPEREARAVELVRAHWGRSGYGGHYDDWMAANPP